MCACDKEVDEVVEVMGELCSVSVERKVMQMVKKKEGGGG